MAGCSIAVGGLIWALPSLIVAHFLFGNVSPRAIKQILTTFAITETLKLVLTVILFIAVIYFLPLSLGYMLVGYGIATVIFWFMPLIFFR